ncbi:MAG: hypothetical protein M1826_002455, partial [Phylliscum demangeonii]
NGGIITHDILTMATPSNVEMVRRLEELERRLEEERLARQEDRRQLEEKDRALEERDRARQEDRRQLEEKDRALKNTTFREFLSACHTQCWEPLAVQTDLKLCTTGSITVPHHRLCPTNLEAWGDFPDLCRGHFDRIDALFHPRDPPTSPRLFPSLHEIEAFGRNLSKKKLSSEQDLSLYLHFALEDRVSMIVEALRSVDPSQRPIDFENHGQSLTKNDEEVQERKRRRTERARLSNADDTPGASRADKMGVTTTVDGARQLLYNIEYKPPHKLTIGFLRAGLRPLDISAVIHRAKVPTDADAKYSYRADQLVARVMTQAYSSMIEDGMEFGYITTGGAFVFLWVEEDNPTTLRWHLSEPNRDVPAAAPDRSLGQTAIGQVLGLSMMAFQSTQRSHAWREEVKKKLLTWKIDDEGLLRNMSPEEAPRTTAPSPDYQPPPSPGEPNPTRTRVATRSRTGCNPADLSRPAFNDREDDHDNDGDERDQPPGERGGVGVNNRRRAPAGGRSSGRNQPGGRNQATAHISAPVHIHAPAHGPFQQPLKSYCTQACLLGLVRGKTDLDECCPNVLLHRQPDTNQHAIDGRDAFADRVKQQLAQTVDAHCQPLGKQGARGALFKITLASHGYTFVAKGTIDVFVEDLQHEGDVYQRRLDRLQGHAVPVYLGNIDLIQSFSHDHGVRIVHMLLLSWAGDDLHAPERRAEIAGLDEAVERTTEEVLATGVIHNDVRWANMLWNQERQRVMLVDYERAMLVQEVAGGRPRVKLPPIYHLSPMVRKRYCTLAWDEYEYGLAKKKRKLLPADEILAAPPAG